jgi:hypothetical protein
MLDRSFKKKFSMTGCPCVIAEESIHSNLRYLKVFKKASE